MNLKYVLAIILVLAPTVYGCVNFQATFIPNSGPGAYPLSAQLWDNLGQNDPPTCSIENGYIGGDGLFDLTCVGSGYSATFNPNLPAAVVVYTRPGASPFMFVAPGTDLSTPEYSACEYGCGQSGCFVKGASV